MPNYLYRCGDDHEHEVWRSIHVRTPRITKCPDCGRTARLTMTSDAIAAPASADRRESVRDIDAREKRWDTDLPAYKRMRDEGLHPRSVDGARALEQGAAHPLEVEMGRRLGKPADVTHAQEIAGELAQNDVAKMGAEIGEERRERAKAKA